VEQHPRRSLDGLKGYGGIEGMLRDRRGHDQDKS
jgi:hypothetical protein